MKPSIALIIAILTATGLAADTGTKPETPKGNANGENRRPVDLQLIKDKVSVKRGEQIVVTLRSEGQRLVPRAPGEKAQPDDGTVKIAVAESTRPPFAVKGDSTRHYLTISNSTGEPLRFRFLAREKGSKEFYEEEAPSKPVRSLGEGHRTIIKCWESGSLVEEVVVCEFTRVLEDARKSLDKSK